MHIVEQILVDIEILSHATQQHVSNIPRDETNDRGCGIMEEWLATSALCKLYGGGGMKF